LAAEGLPGCPGRSDQLTPNGRSIALKTRVPRNGRSVASECLEWSLDCLCMLPPSFLWGSCFITSSPALRETARCLVAVLGFLWIPPPPLRNIAKCAHDLQCVDVCKSDASQSPTFGAKSSRHAARSTDLHLSQVACALPPQWFATPVRIGCSR
jgi:hypothetical protein